MGEGNYVSSNVPVELVITPVYASLTVYAMHYYHHHHHHYHLRRLCRRRSRHHHHLHHHHYLYYLPR